MRNTILIISFLLFAGCATAPVYRGPSSRESNAIISFQKQEAFDRFGECAVCLEAVNDQKITYWRLSDTTRLVPGRNSIFVMGVPPDLRTKAYAELIFDVKSGENYLVKRKAEAAHIHFFILDSAGNIVAEAKGQKKPMTASYQEIPYVPYN